MSTGRQGSHSSRSSCISKGSALALAAAALTPSQKRSSRARSSRVERRRLALGDAADAERPHQPVDRQPLRARPSRRPGPRRRGGRSPSARAGPGRGRSPGRSRGRRRRRPRRGARPSGRAAPAPGPRSPSSSIVPFCLRQRPPRQPVPGGRGRRRRRARSRRRPASNPALHLPAFAQPPHSDCLSVWPAGQEAGGATAMSSCRRPRLLWTSAVLAADRKLTVGRANRDEQGMRELREI